MCAAASVEVVVVGGGLAGWTAARRAQELGRVVMLVERATRTPGWGNTLVSGGALHAALRDPLQTPPDELVRERFPKNINWRFGDRSRSHLLAAPI